MTTSQDTERALAMQELKYEPRIEQMNTNIEDKTNPVIQLDQLGEKPDYVNCPAFHKRSLTRIEYHNSNATK